MFVTSTNEKPDQEEEGHQDTEDHEKSPEEKKFSTENLLKFYFMTRETNLIKVHQELRSRKTSQEDPQSDAKKQMVLGLQKLDGDRKKSLLVRVLDGLLSRPDHRQQDLSTISIEDNVAVDIANNECTTGENKLETRKVYTAYKV